uniref:trans-L-3-hydroxyproline dehydratase n=1 Tax=Oryctolagus cuniculus TaxID=9986 RepID=A0A5F9CY12_RABIT
SRMAPWRGSKHLSQSIGLGLDTCTPYQSAEVRTLTPPANADPVKQQFKIHHPDSEDLAFLYGTILTDGKDAYTEDPTTNLCVFADEQVDRSPTGSGVTARVALQYHKGLLGLNQTRAFRSSATGSVFTGSAVRVSDAFSSGLQMCCLGG